MVFKGRFFSSKKSDSSSPDASNSPRSFGSNSPIRSEKKKVKSTKDDPQIAATTGSSSFGSSFRQHQVKDGLKKKDVKGKEPQSQLKTPAKPSSVTGSSVLNSGSKLRKPVDVKESSASASASASAVSPILASSLGLNRIKTRSGPLPQESFFGFRGDKGSGLGASNLSRPGGDGVLSSGFEAAGKGKKEMMKQSRMGVQENVTFGSWIENGSNSDSMSTGSAQSRDQSPNVPAPSRLQNGESSSEAGMNLPYCYFVPVLIV